MRNYNFSLNAPSAQAVDVRGEFNNWRGLPMSKVNGVWQASQALVAGSYGYKYLVDGSWILDPANTNVKNVAGSPNSAAIMPQLGEMWIALREDNEAGSGAPWDPLNASLTDVGLLLLNIPNYTTIHLGPGTFLTNGILLRQGCKLIGAGRDNTTLRQISANAYGSGSTLAYATETVTSYGDGTDSMVADLTVDMNGDALVAKYGTSKIRTGAVGLTGDNCTIWNVRAIHCHGDFASGLESFPIFIDNDCKPFCSNGLIFNCQIDQYCADSYGGSIAIFDNRVANGGTPGQSNMSNSTVRNCRVIGNNNGTCCYGFCGEKITFENCQAIDSCMFLYYDTGPSSDITIRGCRAYVGSAYGRGPALTGPGGFIYMNLTGNGSIQNFLVENNDIILNGASGVGDVGLANCYSQPSNAGSSKNWKIKNNHIAWDARNPNSSYLKLKFDYLDTITILGNTQDKAGVVDNSLSTNVRNLDP